MTRVLTFPFVVTVLISLSSLALAQDAPSESDYVVRISRLEAQIRQLSGQVEELQFANKKLEETLKKFEQDVEMRFQDMKAQPASPQKSGASEPTNSGPLNLVAPSKAGAAPSGAVGTLAAQAANAKQPPAEPAKPADAKSTLAQAKAAFTAGNFDESGRLARELIQTYPKNALVPEAMIVSGDSDYRLKRFPESAQTYLKLAQTYGNAKQAPLAFAKLGDALVSMGQKTQACATFGEFAKRYPDADAALKLRVEKAQKGAGC